MISKNILIVTHYFLPHVGGIEMVAFNQAKGLVANGHSVTLVTSRVGSTKIEEVIDGIKVVRLASFNFFEKFGIPFPIPYPTGWVTLWSLVRCADIVHVHDAFYANSFIAAVAARFSRKVLMMTQHVALIAYPSKLVQIIQKFVYATTGAIVFSSSQYICVCNDRVRNFLVARGILEHKIKFLPNGVDNKLFNSGTPHQKIELRRKFNLPEIGKVLLFVGRFVPKKGFDKVLAAQSANYHIVCVGGKTPSGVFPNISFMGEVDQFVLADLYKAADIFVLPSESEGFPLSIQEAMSSGLPIITTWDPGYQVYGLDKNNICFIESTETSLKEAIRRIYLDDAALRKMSSYSQEYAAKHFSWSRNVSALEVIYEQTLTSPKLKIALVSDAVYPFSKGGKEKRLFDIATRLVKEGYDVTIYCMQWWRGSKTIEKDGIRYYAISPYYPLYVGSRRSIKQGILFALHCLKLLFIKFDVVDVDHIPHFVIFTMKLVCVLRRKKMIATWHEVWGEKYWKYYLGNVKGRIAFLIEKISIIQPNVIISVSAHTTNALHAMLGTSAKEIITIPNGVDIETIEKSPVSDKTSDIVFAGRLLPHKNVDALLRALQHIQKQRPNISAIIIGDGSEKERLEKISLELGLEKNVSFLGFLPDHVEVYGVLKASRVFVLPSVREGFGITVVEANACGLPVVTVDSEHNAAKDLIDPRGNGMLASLDSEVLASAIMVFLDARKEQDRYKRYAERYNWNSLVGDITALYRKTYE